MAAVLQPEMAHLPHHQHPPRFVIDHRHRSIEDASPLSPASTLSPILQKPESYSASSPVRAYYSPSRDSFLSKPSISEASHVPSSPSVASYTSEHQRSAHSHHSTSNRHSPNYSQRPSGHYSHRNSRDAEKLAAEGSQDPQRYSRGPTILTDHTTTVTYNDGHDWRDERRRLEAKALGILVRVPPTTLIQMDTANVIRYTSPASPQSYPSSPRSGPSYRSCW